ncbi:MAG TPA: ABC transporter ATP-binding protein, partial [Chitinophagaceae bacterium]|nr:ABC transporter ATP-binding protein [Chitinophagaceae bacterium]
VVISAADIASLALLLYILHFYSQTGAAHPLPFLPASLFSNQSILLIGLFFVFFSLKNYAGYQVNKAQYHFFYGIASRISHNNLLRYFEGSFTDYTGIDSSVHVKQISLQPLECCQFVLAGLQQAFTEIVLILLTITAILLFNAQLFLLLMLLLLPPFVLVSWLTKKKLQSARLYLKTSREKMWQHVHESIAAFVESNIYDKNLFFTRRYSESQDTLNQYQSTLHAMQGMPARMTEVFAVFGLMALIAIGNYSGTLHNATQVVTLGAFTAAAYKLIPGIARLLNLAGQVQTYSFTLQGLVKKGPAQTAETTAAETDPITTVDCRNIHFHYNRNEIIRGLNLQLRKGDFIGIQGDSGKGKTTLLNIIAGFLSPGSGEVLFNGAPADEADTRRRWKRMAYVKQQPFIMHDTILANIILDTGGYDRQRLQSALAAAGLEPFLLKQPAGIHTILSENGRNISGGQRQRIALARALYKEADLYLLDEPFSELDEASETSLLQHFAGLARQGKLVLLVTHNKKSLSYCTQVVSAGREKPLPA